MKVKFLQRLNRVGIIKKDKVHVDSVYNMPFPRLVDLLDEITADTFQPSEDFRPSAHIHCASFTLGGGRAGCASPECRLKELNELARFAALYSDQVVIHNYLADYAPSWGHPPDKDSDSFRQDLVDDIHLLLFIRPLIEANKVVVFTPPLTTCPYCYAERLFGSKADQRLRRAVKMLSDDLFKQMRVEFFKDELGYAVEIQNVGDVFGHQTQILPFESLPRPLSARLLLAKQIRDGEKITLSREWRQKLSLHSQIAEDVLTSLRYQMSVAEVVGASFLTNQDADIKILQYISKDSSVNRRNEIAAKHLKAIVPFAGDVPINKLLRLRQREEAAFIQFRAALDVALKEIISQGGTFSERDARALHSDVIAPEIARLDQRVKEAKRDLIRAPLASAAGATAMIAFGLYSGMVPAELNQIASALGLAKVVYDAASKAIELGDVHRSIRPERFYFLWRVKNLVRKTRPSRTRGLIQRI